MSRFAHSRGLFVALFFSLGPGICDAESLVFEVLPGQEVTFVDYGLAVNEYPYELVGTLVVTVDDSRARSLARGLRIVPSEGERQPWPGFVGDELFGRYSDQGIELEGVTASGNATGFELVPVEGSETEWIFRGGISQVPGDPSSFWTWEVRVDLVATSDAMILQGGRFEVRAEWRDYRGGSGDAGFRLVTSDGGYLWFFNSSNPELMVKVLDGCGTQSRSYWVYASGLTDVGVDLWVTDRLADRTRLYTNSLGNPFEPIRDTVTFDTCSDP